MGPASEPLVTGSQAPPRSCSSGQQLGSPQPDSSTRNSLSGWLAWPPLTGEETEAPGQTDMRLSVVQL